MWERQENIENTHRLFKAVEERDVAGVLATYDPEIVIRDAESLPYGGIYHGLEGAKQHIEGAAQTWNPFKPSPAERKLDAVFLDCAEYVIALWRLKGLELSSGRRIDLPAVNVYKLRNGKIVESQMFYRGAEGSTLNVLIGWRLRAGAQEGICDVCSP
ncbi:nuclear transport factor 2 family protein [Scytonema sp. PCC 10023]|uniref:nuclear transport factor 2 family protein n=1 Tax=Scytonema sp. PCC 10023 TaxID=1680591 RepID=UPI0039C655EF